MLLALPQFQLEDFFQSINELGLPGWVVIILVLIAILHYTGVLQGMGQFAGNVITGNQKRLAELQAEALKQNGILISYITDRLTNDIEELEDRANRLEDNIKGEFGKVEKAITGDKGIVHRLATIETHNRMIAYELTERAREAKQGQSDHNFELISGLQEKLGLLEARLQQEISEKSNNQT